jgi:DNA processing protein
VGEAVIVTGSVCRGEPHEDALCAVALAYLNAGPRRLRRFLEGLSPSDAWRAISEARHPADPDGTYAAQATGALVEAARVACTLSGASVLLLGRPGYPASLAEDAEAPAVLFAYGDPTICDPHPRVAIVGTRSATPYGTGVAFELGRALCESGVAVISGLARGIDSAAHAGALEARDAKALAIVGTAIDSPQSRSQDELRHRLAERGAVVSELPPGSSGGPAWSFAVRNRLIAAAAHVVVVVECHARGGALHTVRYASKRGVRVAAVPGSVRSPASAGTNALIVDGAHAVRGVEDVLSILESVVYPSRISPVPAREASPARPRGPVASACPVSPRASKVLDALDHDPAGLDTIVSRCGLSIGETALSLEELTAIGLAENEGTWWCRPRR